MHIELIGSTSAGKTTLAKRMVEVGKNSEIDISLSDDFMLKQLHLDWIRNDFLRRRIVEIIAYVLMLTCLGKYKKFIKFVIREGNTSPGSQLYKFNRVRNVFRKIGIFEFISRKSSPQQIILADNEGILQGVHNLFVHQNSQIDLSKISKYVELVPMPDVVLYLQQDEVILVSRTLARGHTRVSRSSPVKVRHFIRQAVAVFDEMINVPKVQERLLLLDGELNIQPETTDIMFDRVTELLRAGSSIS